MDCKRLMIVVAIIGILAAIAIPAYQSYIAKSQMTRAYAELSALKTNLESCLSNGELPVGKCEVGFGGSDIMSTAAPILTTAGTVPTATTNTAALTSEVALTGTLAGKAASAVSGTKFELARSANGIWACTVTPSTDAGWDDKFIPSGCSK